MSEPASRRRIREEVTNERYVPRVQELIAQGGEFFVVKVLNGNLGYLVQCDIPSDPQTLVKQIPLVI
jgi:hypothetical protein